MAQVLRNGLLLPRFDRIDAVREEIVELFTLVAPRALRIRPLQVQPIDLPQQSLQVAIKCERTTTVPADWSGLLSS